MTKTEQDQINQALNTIKLIDAETCSKMSDFDLWSRGKMLCEETEESRREREDELRAALVQSDLMFARTRAQAEQVRLQARELENRMRRMQDADSYIPFTSTSQITAVLNQWWGTAMPPVGSAPRDAAESIKPVEKSPLNPVILNRDAPRKLAV